MERKVASALTIWSSERTPQFRACREQEQEMVSGCSQQGGHTNVVYMASHRLKKKKKKSLGSGGNLLKVFLYQAPGGVGSGEAMPAGSQPLGSRRRNSVRCHCSSHTSGYFAGLSSQSSTEEGREESVLFPEATGRRH